MTVSFFKSTRNNLITNLINAALVLVHTKPQVYSFSRRNKPDFLVRTMAYR